MVRSDAWRCRPCVLKYWAFKDEIRKQTKALGFRESGKIIVTFWIPIPKSWAKKKKIETEGQPHLQVPDTDNLLKALLDCLWEDDKGVWKVSMEKRWCAEGMGSIELL